MIPEQAVLATSGNTGGYRLLTTFGINFPRIVRSVFSDDHEIADIFIKRTLWSYLPGLVWMSRNISQGKFSSEAPWPGMRQALGQYLMFWLVITPLMRFPRVAAGAVYLLWRTANRVARRFDARIDRRLLGQGASR